MRNVSPLRNWVNNNMGRQMASRLAAYNAVLLKSGSRIASHTAKDMAGHFMVGRSKVGGEDKVA